MLLEGRLLIIWVELIWLPIFRKLEPRIIEPAVEFLLLSEVSTCFFDMLPRCYISGSIELFLNKCEDYFMLLPSPIILLA